MRKIIKTVTVKEWFEKRKSGVYMDKYIKATGKKMILTQASMDEFMEWVKINEPDFYNSYKQN